jgi:acylphosphatase
MLSFGGCYLTSFGSPRPTRAFLSLGLTVSRLQLQVMGRKHVIVSGLVQGVFFRDACRRTAIEHGVSGWVRNLPDGDVEMVFEGADDAIERMVRWAHAGPLGADVRDVEVREEEPEGLRGFDVLPTPRS